MKLLFDTHTFIWWDSQPNNLSQTALTLLQDRSNILLLSVISIWEMQIKLQLGKLTLNRSLLEIIENQQQTNQIVSIATLFVRVDK
ncbi:type II toxin-antitoxin system VapC family toxin [Phormidium sp. LEGE 05292]|uniref:type II toxin-antitoxin system VapC family toxin n=1 Tax=[Phormidium] sp. LEGE 05292 TaxID=767427 RepID=UPI00187EAF83|nr:type II toxin-antitoxin system VapC family toxin [Phormidium sp. LEGE 05292]MBE9224687.1 type II toxin-antitoxin system VapC family toxin [Phormidium sp. LEGE 05292]